MINFPDKHGNWLSYFHIPKNAGSSILSSIFGYGLIDIDQGVFTYYQRRLRFGALHYVDYQHSDHYTYQIAQELGYTIFDNSLAFVRNPWHRCVSNFLYVRNGGGLPADCTFAEWLYGEKGTLVAGNPYYICQPGTLTSQAEYVIDAEGKVAVTQIYRLEDLDIFEFFEQLLGRKFSREHKNTARQHYDYRTFYAKPALIDRVAELYAKDLELFGYAYE